MAVAESWMKYYRDPKADLRKTTRRAVLAIHQTALFSAVSQEISSRLRDNQEVALWSAGSGIDHISLALKTAFGQALRLTLQDISPECIELNQELFRGAGADAEFVVGDLFESKAVGRFDIVMNSGLLEHFDTREQEQLLAIFSKSLRPGGVYLTLVPYLGARYFNFIHRRSAEKGVWPFGPENPLRTLRGLASSGLVLERENQVGALDQFALIGLPYPVVGQAIRPVMFIGRRSPISVDHVLVKLVGGYCLLDRFVNRS